MRIISTFLEYQKCLQDIEGFGAKATAIDLLRAPGFNYFAYEHGLILSYIDIERIRVGCRTGYHEIHAVLLNPTPHIWQNGKMVMGLQINLEQDQYLESLYCNIQGKSGLGSFCSNADVFVIYDFSFRWFILRDRRLEVCILALSGLSRDLLGELESQYFPHWLGSLKDPSGAYAEMLEVLI